MGVTIWGLLMVLTAVFLFISRGLKGIYQAVVFTAPLFITVVTTVPLGSTVLRSSYFFGIIFIVLYTSIIAVKNTKYLKTNQEPDTLFFRKDLFPFYAFLLIITVSLFMPFFLENNVSVISFESKVGVVEDLSFKKLEFQQSNLTQLIYPIFQIVLFTFVASYVTAHRNIQKTISLLYKASYFVLATGFLHIILIQIGGAGILQIINIIITGTTYGNASIGGGILGLARMHSWAGEPGYSSFLFLAILGFILAVLLTGNYVICKNRRKTVAVLLLFLLGIIFSTGTTGYVGIIILFFFAFMGSFAVSKRMRNVRRSYLVTPIIVIMLLFAWIELATGFSFFSFFQEEHISKLTELSGSGLVRFTIVAQNFQSFLESPILGVGYGSERSLALSAFLLANTGLAGFCSFIFLGLFLMKKMWNIMKSRYASNDQKTYALGFFISFGTMFTLMQFAKSESSLLFHYFWIIAACMLALYRIHKSQKQALINASDF